MFATTGLAPALANEPALAELYGSLPTVAEAAISPDGKTVAQLQNIDGVKAVAFVSLDGTAPPVGMELSNAKARRLLWAGPEHILLLVSGTTTISRGEGLRTYEVWRWYAIDREAKKFVIPFKGYRWNFFYFGSGWLESLKGLASDSVVMAHGSPYSLYEVNLRTGAERRIESGAPETVDWVTTPSGEPAVRIDHFSRTDELRFLLKSDSSSRFRPAARLDQEPGEEWPIYPEALGEAPGRIIGMSESGGFDRIRTFDAASGAFVDEGIGPSGYDVEDAIIDPYSGNVAGYRYTDDFQRAVFFDDRLRAAQSDVERALPNAAPVVTSWSRNYLKFIARVSYPDHPDQFYLFDKTAKSLSMIAPSYASLDGKVVARKERYDYRTDDGLTVTGYLTAPSTSNGKKAPLIVMPHGGPFARDDMSFDWWAYFYAANGYAVYQPNFRGSTGYGSAFERAGFLQWGGKMQDDVTNGVRNLIADGVADPDRICIVGASYGGYAALIGATFTPELYACAVSVAGVSNLPAMIAYQTGRGRVEEDAWDVRIGGRIKDNEELRRLSPAYQAARTKTPVMLIHGDDDTVVPMDQSTLMRAALEKECVQPEFVILKGEDHWLSRGVTRTQMLERSLEFISRHIGEGRSAGEVSNN